MTHRTAHRGASTRFLALLASSTMIVTGMAGLGLAAPASANPNWADECSRFSGWVQSEDNYTKLKADLSYDEGVPDTASASFTVPNWKGTWSSTRYVLGVVVKSGANSQPGSTGAPGMSGGWTTQTDETLEDESDYQNLSHLTFCYGTITPPDTSLIVNKKWVGINGTASEELAAKLGGGNAGPLKVKIDGDDVENPSWGAPGITGLTEGDEVEIDEGGIPAVDSSLFPSGYTCEVVDNRPADDGDREESDLESRAIEETQYPQLPKPFDLEAGENLATVTNAVVCTAIPVTPPPPGGSTPPPAEVTPPVEVTPVVEAAVASAPEAAAIAPAPATVSVPAAAKLPAAVPAGDGSQAPGLPIWALALMAVGLLGAGFSARSWAASRK